MSEQLFRPASQREQPGEDPMRRLVADSEGQPYVSHRTLDDAKADPDGVVILQGDDGGQIFVVARGVRVSCDQGTLEQLLRDLDAIEWPGNYPDMASIVYERQPVGAGVAGGMGGAVATDGIWVHPRLRERGLAVEIESVLTGMKTRVGRDGGSD